MHLEDLPIGETFQAGTFRLSAAEIIDFAGKYDPQPFHLDPEAAKTSYFGKLCASGLHTQGMAIALIVQATRALKVVAGYALHEARFHEPVWPDTTYNVAATWRDASPSPSNPTRGRANLVIHVTRDTAPVATLGVTYVLERRPAKT